MLDVIVYTKLKIKKIFPCHSMSLMNMVRNVKKKKVDITITRRDTKRQRSMINIKNMKRNMVKKLGHDHDIATTRKRVDTEKLKIFLLLTFLSSKLNFNDIFFSLLSYNNARSISPRQNLI